MFLATAGARGATRGSPTGARRAATGRLLGPAPLTLCRPRSRVAPTGSPTISGTATTSRIGHRVEHLGSSGRTRAGWRDNANGGQSTGL